MDFHVRVQCRKIRGEVPLVLCRVGCGSGFPFGCRKTGGNNTIVAWELSRKEEDRFYLTPEQSKRRDFPHYHMDWGEKDILIFLKTTAHEKKLTCAGAAWQEKFRLNAWNGVTLGGDGGR